jgi:archaetidylinositol phosphate synthase
MATTQIAMTLDEKARGFKPARREVEGLTASLERQTLQALAARMPAWVQSDHLTAIGFLATMGAGLAYAARPLSPAWLLVAVFFLALNWFGDSLDGTLARYRRQERPRYGFYIDHMVDAIGAVYVFGGLACSGLLRPGLAISALVAYLLLEVHVCLASYTAGHFKISYGVLGVTEMRLLLAAATAAAIWWPTVDLGVELRLFDLVGGAATLGLAAILLTDIPRISIALRRAETPRE